MDEGKWWWRPGVQRVRLHGNTLYLSRSRARGVRAMYEDRVDAEEDDPFDPDGPIAWAIVYRGGRIARFHEQIGHASDLERVDDDS